MNRSIFKNILLVFTAIAITLIVDNYVTYGFCMGLYDRLISLGYKLVPNNEIKQIYKFKQVSGENFNNIIEYYYTNQKSINWRIVKLTQPENLQGMAAKNYFNHYFLQLYILNYDYFINFPFTNGPMLGDSFIRFCGYENNNNEKPLWTQCLTNNLTITNTIGEIQKIDELPEKIQIIAKSAVTLKGGYENLINAIIQNIAIGN